MRMKRGQVPQCLHRTRKYKYTNEDLEVMKLEIFASIEHRLVNEGADDDEASELARDTVERLSNKQIIKKAEELKG